MPAQTGSTSPSTLTAPPAFLEELEFRSGGDFAATVLGTTAVGDYTVNEDGDVVATMDNRQTLRLKQAAAGRFVGVSDPGLVAAAARDGVELDEMSSLCPD